MARETAQGVRRLANHTYRGGGHRVADRSLEDGNRASNTYRRRYRDRDATQGRGLLRARLIDRMTYENGSQVNLAVRDACDNNLARTTNPQQTSTNIAAQDTQGSSLFCTQEVQSTQDDSLFCTQEVQPTQGTSLFCTQVAEASQAPLLAPVPKPAITRKSMASIPPIKLTNKAKGIQGNRGNSYRGKDAIKRKVQNPKLRAIFADKPLPRAPKKHDELVLRMGLRDKGT